MLLLLALLVIATLCGCSVGVVVRTWPVSDLAQSVTQGIGREMRRGRLARFIRARVDPAAATGLALTIALAGVVIGGAVVGVLLYMVRAHAGLAGVDRRLAVWGAAHATGLSTAVLRAITQMGATVTIVGVTVLAGAWEYRRLHSRYTVLFLGLVVVGQNVIANLIKVGVDRVRPGVDPLTFFSGSSFPSGHTTAAAACYAAIALLAGRRRSPRARSIVAGAAAAIAVAVATSRVLLGVHWLTDVLAGLALGWSWFALCSIAFGERMLRFGDPAEPDKRPSAN